MYNLYPYFTNDGSVGLYSPTDNDIYHSTYGAMTEAYEKFILPCNFKKYFENNNEIKILDICFGIGYNSKIFLKYFLENIYNEKLYSDNIIYNYKLYGDNTKPKIFIHAIEKDKILSHISPFFKIGNKKDVISQKLIFENNKIKERLSENVKFEEQRSKCQEGKLNKISNYNLSEILTKFFINSKTYNISMELYRTANILILKSIINNIDNDVLRIINNPKYSQFFDADMIRYYQFIQNHMINNTSLRRFNAFLHNIYYRNISKGYKMAFKWLKNVDFTFKLSNEDARKVIIDDKERYNYVFLDAFSPDKCPMLWTYDFLKCIYEHMEDNGVLLTYTSSARVRKALIDIGFYIYKTYSVSQDKFCGTVAVKSKTNNKIKCNLPSPLAQSEIEDLNKCNFPSPLAGEGRVRGATSDELSSISSEPEGRVRGAIHLNNEIIYSLSEYELNLLNTKAGIYYRDNNLNLTNEEILQNHKTDVEKSKLMSTTQYKKLSEYNE